MVELVIVVLVMGILAGVAAPKYADSLDYYRVESASKRIAADLRYARALAIRTAAEQKVAFDTATGSYALPGAADINTGGAGYTVSLAGEGYPADIQTASFSGAATVTFDHQGDTHTRGGLAVRSGSQARYVLVSPLGEVTIGKQNDAGDASDDPDTVISELLDGLLGAT